MRETIKNFYHIDTAAVLRSAVQIRSQVQLLREAKQQKRFNKARQKIFETCRARFTHHCEPNMNGSLLQTTPLWCAERTLRIPFQKLLCSETFTVSFSMFCGECIFRCAGVKL
jgi:hypothetical protein